MDDQFVDLGCLSKAYLLTKWRSPEAANGAHVPVNVSNACWRARSDRNLGANRVAIHRCSGERHVEVMVFVSGIEKESVVVFVAGIETA